jgi:hypothetical protein
VITVGHSKAPGKPINISVVINNKAIGECFAVLYPLQHGMWNPVASLHHVTPEFPTCALIELPTRGPSDVPSPRPIAASFLPAPNKASTPVPTEGFTFCWWSASTYLYLCAKKGEARRRSLLVGGRGKEGRDNVSPKLPGSISSHILLDRQLRLKRKYVLAFI